MKAQQVPKTQQPPPSVDPTQSDVAATKLARAQRLLRKSVMAGLKLHGSKETQHTALGEDCEEHPHNLHCHLSKTNPMTPEEKKNFDQQQRKSHALARVRVRQHALRRAGVAGEKVETAEGGAEVGGAAAGGQEQFAFPEDMLKRPPLHVDENNEFHRHAIGPSLVVSIGMFVIVSMVALVGAFAYMRIRK